MSAKIKDTSYGIDAGGVFLNPEEKNIRIFIKFSRWNRMSRTAEIEEGNIILTAPVKVEESGGALRLSLEDIDDVKIKKISVPVKIEEPQKVPEQTLSPASENTGETSPDDFETQISTEDIK